MDHKKRPDAHRRTRCRFEWPDAGKHPARILPFFCTRCEMLRLPARAKARRELPAAEYEVPIRRRSAALLRPAPASVRKGRRADRAKRTFETCRAALHKANSHPPAVQASTYAPPESRETRTGIEAAIPGSNAPGKSGRLPAPQKDHRCGFPHG
ncbi:hypothetical protein SDC9_99062 [bioreactor metagenome]|uniref:Uncharacterized protein n=1 Tax=bioreactor metagenome TaxID=1076179 RepID=A0A645AN65_9ZZZZ